MTNDWPRKRFQIYEKEPNESAMMCWESLDDLEQASKKRKTPAHDAKTNDNKEIQANEMDDKVHTNCTTVDELKLGADDDTWTLATQETSVKSLVYITNIPEGKLGPVKNVRDSSKNPSEKDNKKSSHLETSNFVTSNDNLNAYGESGRC